jgi:hypothetical protein
LASRDAHFSLAIGGSPNLDQREFQSLPHPGGGTTPFRPTACLELTADGRQIIAADQFSVWLLDLANVDD